VNASDGVDKISVKASSRGVSVARKPGAVLIQHAEVTDMLTVNGGAGVDRITAAPNVSSAIALTINPD
jgi:hypothetical protein